MNSTREIIRILDKKAQLNSIYKESYSEEDGAFFADRTHFSNRDAHHSENHALRHAQGGEDPLQPLDIGAAVIYRQNFSEVNELLITHNFTSYPLVQVLETIDITGEGDLEPIVVQRVVTDLMIEHLNESELRVSFTSLKSGVFLCAG